MLSSYIKKLVSRYNQPVRSLICLWIGLAPITELQAQFQGFVYEEDTTIHVYANSQRQPLAWSGGMNNPQFTSGDLDHDGVNDLVVFESVNARVKTFLNKGTPGNPYYVYAPQYAKNFPVISDYLIMGDYNRDGIADLFHMGDGIVASRDGFAVFKGYYNAQNELCFEFYRTLWYTNDTYGVPPVNAYVNPSDIPAIVDVDGDGDLDFIAYGNFYNQPMYYQNLQQEDHLPADSIRIRLADWCWGKIAHGNGIARGYNMRFSCDIANGGLKRPEKAGSANKTTHSGDALCVFDADGDGDMDYLAGNVSFNDMVFLQNGKRNSGKNIDSMVYQDTTWQSTSGGRKIDLPQWPAAYWLDVDGDNRKDLLVSPHAPYTSENYKCVWYYKNTPSGYVFQKDTFLIDQMIDVGSAAYPMLYDYNKDGKPDLFVGSDGYYQSGGSFRSRLAYYENTSTAGRTSFSLVNKDQVNLFAANVRGSAPSFGDLDNDGLDDLVLGHADGTLRFYKNTAVSNTVQPIWEQRGKLMDKDGAEISVGGNAMPFIYDLSKDGVADLIIGSVNGTLVYYRNLGTQGQVQLQKETDSLGKIVVNDYFGKSAPFIGRMDNTTREYLVVGSDRGNLYRYTDFQNGNVRIPYTRIDSNYSFIDAGLHTALTIGDLDGDGKYEMIVGNEFGGLNMYHQVLEVDTNLNPIPNNTADIVPGTGLLQLYPNPASNLLYLGLSGMEFSENARIVICNNMGQYMPTVFVERNKANIGLDISPLPPGVYLCMVENQGLIRNGIFIKK